MIGYNTSSSTLLRREEITVGLVIANVKLSLLHFICTGYMVAVLKALGKISNCRLLPGTDTGC